jgi:acetyl esterase/lipase
VANIDMTAYPADLTDEHPAFIICPGGGYWRHAPHNEEPIAAWLNSIGISAYVLRYSLKPERPTAPVEDLLTAIRTLRSTAKEQNIDPAKIGVIGFSAGGHLATTASTRFDNGNPDAGNPFERLSSRPDAVILSSSVVSFDEHAHEGTVLNLLGDNPSEALRTSFSNHGQVRRDTPPTFLWHTADDPVVAVENSLLYASALRINDVPFELHIFPHGPHNPGLASDDPAIKQWTGLAETWLRSLGF